MVYELPKFNIKSKRNIGLSSFTKSLHFIFFYVQIYTYIHKIVPKVEQNRGEMKMSRKGPLPASPCHEETGSCAPSGRCPRETQPAVAISSIGPSPGSSHEMRGFWAHEDRLAPWLQAAGLVGALGSTTKSFRASRYQAQHVTKRETAAATTEPLFCHHCDSRLPQLLGPALGNVLARLQEVYIQGFKLNGEAFLSTPVFEEMWDKLRRSFPRDVVKEGPASSSDEEGLIQANATLEVHPMHFSMGPQGSLLYVLVALAGDGQYVQLAQHVHHVSKS